MDLDDSLIPNQHLVIPGSSELSYTSSLASAPERMMLLTTQGELLSLMGSLPQSETTNVPGYSCSVLPQVKLVVVGCLML